PDLPIHVIRPEVPEVASEQDLLRALCEKANLFDRTPFKETLFLDLDTVVLDDLSFGFAQAGHHGLACCICDSPWARRHGAWIQERDMIEYNSGVMFFTEAAEPVFRGWQKLARAADWSILFVDQAGNAARMPYNDQGSLAKAVHDARFNPFVLPLN